jgi:hypothetical protein
MPRRSDSSESRRIRRKQRLPVFVAGFVGVMAVIGFSVFITVSLLETISTARDLNSTLTSVSEIEDLDGAQRVLMEVPEMRDQSARLVSQTRNLPWRLLQLSPGIGADARAFADVASVADEILEKALPIAVMAKSESFALRRENGAIDVKAIEQIASSFLALSDALDRSHARLADISAGDLQTEMRDRVPALRGKLQALISPTREIGEFMMLVPGLLGLNEERQWLFILENPAEARGGGGFPGGFVQMKASQGVMDVVAIGNSSDLNRLRIPLAAAPEAIRALVGDDQVTRWNTFNQVPDFPVLAEMAAASFGVSGNPVDIVLGVDPKAVAAMIEVTGPISYRGKTISSRDAEHFFVLGQYLDFPNKEERDDIAMGLVAKVLQEFFGLAIDPFSWFATMRESFTDGRIRVWSDDPREQTWLSARDFGGSLARHEDSDIALALNNSAGNKMDAFMQTSVLYRRNLCEPAERSSGEVSVTIANEAPTDLPRDSGYFEPPRHSYSPFVGAPFGDSSLIVGVYGPVNARLLGVYLDNLPLRVFEGNYEGRPVWITEILVSQGEKRNLRFEFLGSSLARGDGRVVVQPMYNPTKIMDDLSYNCSGDL